MESEWNRRIGHNSFLFREKGEVDIKKKVLSISIVLFVIVFLSLSAFFKIHNEPKRIADLSLDTAKAYITEYTGMSGTVSVNFTVRNTQAFTFDKSGRLYDMEAGLSSKEKAYSVNYADGILRMDDIVFSDPLRGLELDVLFELCKALTQSGFMDRVLPGDSRYYIEVVDQRTDVQAGDPIKPLYDQEYYSIADDQGNAKQWEIDPNLYNISSNEISAIQGETSSNNRIVALLIPIANDSQSIQEELTHTQFSQKAYYVCMEY